jgi:hypothetical protein
MQAAIGYLRVSTAEQGRSGLGLAAQRHEIESFGAREGFSVKSWYQDVQTGAGADALLLRPGLVTALKAARAARCPLIVSRLDRLSRNVHRNARSYCLPAQRLGRMLTPANRVTDPMATERNGVASRVMRGSMCYSSLILAIGMGAGPAHPDQVPGCEFASLVEVKTVTALPADVLSATGKMADRDQPFNATDYIRVGLPGQRFVVAGIGSSCLLIEYEVGGFIPSTRVQEFIKEGLRWRKSRAWQFFGRTPTSLTKLLQCVEGSCRD